MRLDSERLESYLKYASDCDRFSNYVRVDPLDMFELIRLSRLGLIQESQQAIKPTEEWGNPPEGA